MVVSSDIRLGNAIFRIFARRASNILLLALSITVGVSLLHDIDSSELHAVVRQSHVSHYSRSRFHSQSADSILSKMPREHHSLEQQDSLEDSDKQFAELLRNSNSLLAPEVESSVESKINQNVASYPQADEADASAPMQDEVRQALSPAAALLLSSAHTARHQPANKSDASVVHEATPATPAQVERVQRRDVVDFDKADPGASDYPRTQMEQLVVYGNGNKVLVDGKPSTLAYSHMAMIELLPDGRLVAAWQGSSVIEGSTDQRIYLSYSLDEEGREWATPESVPEKLREAGQWSPVLHCDQSGALWLFYAESATNCLRKPINRPGKPPVPQRWAVGGHIKALIRNPDGTWENPRMLYPMSQDRGVPKVVANKLMVLTTGEWLLPFWRQRSYQVCETDREFNSVGVMISRDQGDNWSVHGSLSLPLKTHWVIEGTIMEMTNTTLLMLLRSSEGFIYHSLSNTKGRTWSALVQTSLPNPDSKIHGIRLSSGELALSYNNHARTFTGMQKGREGMKRREKLLLALSRDDGATWVPVARLDIGVASHLRDYMMFHYPTLLQRGNTLFIAYSRTYLDRTTAPKPLQNDGIWIARLSLLKMSIGHPTPLFDPQACRTTGCLVSTGIASSGETPGALGNRTSGHHSQHHRPRRPRGQSRDVAHVASTLGAAAGTVS